MKTKKLVKSSRAAPRKSIEPLEVSSIALIGNMQALAKEALIVQASTTGFLMLVKRENLIPKELRQNLSLDVLVGTTILLYLPQMNIEITGMVARTKLLGKKGYELGIDYTADAPEYWRECLIDLLPVPGELD